MPLLKKKPLEKCTIPEYLRDDEEVFYCEITDEIFRDYEEFSERMFLYNSMVWTCSMTGKQNLTYQEALESEENAKQSLKEFPVELRIPILYLASKTLRTSFGDMADDVFMYVKDRYFIGENLETSFTGSKWKDSHVLQVIAPSVDRIGSPQKSPPKNGSNVDRNFWPPANLFKYEIEHLDADDNDISEIMIVDCNQIRRKKTFFSRDKCKLFLKQYVEHDSNGLFVIKPSVIEDFGLNKMKFDQIFDGPPPNFEMSKKKEKLQNGKKKSKQETLAKFLSKNNEINANSTKETGTGKKNLLEAMKKREEEFKVKKQMKEEEKMALKKKQKSDSIKLNNAIKDWMKQKEDLELEDQKVLPVPTPVKSKVPDEYFGDMLMVMEFVESFSKLLSTKDFFPGGFTLEIMERALTENEVAGPFIDIIQMFLTALFNAQDEESNQYRTALESTAGIKEEVSNNLSLTDATRLATLASSWSNRYQGLPLGRLPLYSVTVSEILRLHLLSSGARINETGAKWRYAQRGGYTSEDDPGLHLRLHQPHILKALAVHNVVQLPLIDKLKILSCLMNQLLTYADVRDVVEERLDKSKQLKADLKAVQSVERKREHEFVTAKCKIQKEMKGDPRGLKEALEKLEQDSEKRQIENSRKISKLMKSIYDEQPQIGTDRAFRRYLRLDSVPGIFVNAEELNAGVCSLETTKQNADLVDATRQQLLKHMRRVHIDEVDSEIETKSPKKNGSLISTTSQDSHAYNNLLMCSADPTTCKVHSTSSSRHRWSFFHDDHCLDELSDTLNNRGVREGELLQALKNDRDRLTAVVQQTPVAVLNETVVAPKEDEQKTENRRSVNRKGKDRYEDANLGYPPTVPPEGALEAALVDNILEMEEKIYGGGLGLLGVKDRDEWRTRLAAKSYDDLDKNIVKQDKGKLMKVKKGEKTKNGSRPTTPDPSTKNELKEYQDPGRFLGASSEAIDGFLGNSEELQRSVKALAVALAQVAQAVEPKYLKKPLGMADVTKPDKKQDYDYLDRWEQSLLASTSYSQVFLHYGTLDSCVMWSRSALLARCRICRRQKDSENMLLCDSCNLGHHLYCLKPKLTSIPKGDWFCDKCNKEKEKQAMLLSPQPTPAKKRRIFRDEDIEEEEETSGGEEEQEEEEDEDSEEEMEVDEVATIGDAKPDLCSTCQFGGDLITCEKCTSNYHIECCDPPMRRAPRGSWLCQSCKTYRDAKERTDRRGDSRNDSDSGDEIVHQRRSQRKEGDRMDLPLHNVALQELLAEVMKQDEAWPFLRPVQKTEVPDYYDVITKPMDFGTIKYKLNMGKYKEDSELMRDVVLVFENCNTYNDTDAEVYRCGVKLLKFFEKRAKELGLKLPEEMESDDSRPPKSKKRRNK